MNSNKINDISQMIPDWDSLNAAERRRARNKILARESRGRAKIRIEELKLSCERLLNENKALKKELQDLSDPEKFPTFSAAELLGQNTDLPDEITNAVSICMDQMNIADCIQNISFCVINTSTPNFCIVNASESFLEFTGLDRHEIIGQQGFNITRLFNGYCNDTNALKALSLSLTHGRNISLVLKIKLQDGSEIFDKITIVHLKYLCRKSFLAVATHIPVDSMPAVKCTTASNAICHKNTNDQIMDIHQRMPFAAQVPAIQIPEKEDTMKTKFKFSPLNFDSAIREAVKMQKPIRSTSTGTETSNTTTVSQKQYDSLTSASESLEEEEPKLKKRKYNKRKKCNTNKETKEESSFKRIFLHDSCDWAQYDFGGIAIRLNSTDDMENPFIGD